MIPRRDFLIGGGLALICANRRAPAYVIRDHQRPQLNHGVASGDPTPDGALIWSRTDRLSRMRVEWSLRPDFKSTQTIVGSIASE